MLLFFIGIEFGLVWLRFCWIFEWIKFGVNCEFGIDGLLKLGIFKLFIGIGLFCELIIDFWVMVFWNVFCVGNGCGSGVKLFIVVGCNCCCWIFVKICCCCCWIFCEFIKLGWIFGNLGDVIFVEFVLIKLFFCLFLKLFIVFFL